MVARAPPVVPGGGPFWVTRLGRACSVCSADPDHYLLCLAAALRASRRRERVRQRGGVCVFQGEGGGHRIRGGGVTPQPNQTFAGNVKTRDEMKLLVRFPEIPDRTEQSNVLKFQ